MTVTNLFANGAINVLGRTGFGVGLKGSTNVTTLARTGATNGMRNSNNAGLIAGTPGTLANFWTDNAAYPLNGISRSIAGPFVENGIPYYEVTHTGTCTGSGFALNMVLDGNIPPCLAQVGQTWTATIYEMKSAGSYVQLSGGAPFLLLCEWKNGSLLATSNVAMTDNGVFSQSRNSVTRTFTNVGTNAASILIQWNFTLGNVYNFTTRIGGAMIQQTPKATAFLNSLGTVPATTAMTLLSSVSSRSIAAMFGRTGSQNLIRNNSMQGNVSGTPGTLPTFWGIGGNALVSGLSQQIVGNGSIGNQDYIDLRIFGSTATSPFLNYFLEGLTQIPACAGQTYTTSASLAIVGGTSANAGPIAAPGVLGRTATGGSNESVISNPILTSTLTKYQATLLLVSNQSAFATPCLSFNFGAAGAVDVTVRIVSPSFELSGAATPVVRTINSYVGNAFVASSAITAISNAHLKARTGVGVGLSSTVKYLTKAVAGLGSKTALVAATQYAARTTANVGMRAALAGKAAVTFGLHAVLVELNAAIYLFARMSIISKISAKLRNFSLPRSTNTPAVDRSGNTTAASRTGNTPATPR